MFLHRIHLNLRCKEARRDLADPYQLHSTLCRAFSPPEQKVPEGEFLWRIEPEDARGGFPSILVQSRTMPDWGAIGVSGWLDKADPAVDLKARLNLDSLKSGARFRFRLRANPSVTRKGKRQGLLLQDDQEKWIERKGSQHGFVLPGLEAFYYPESDKHRVDVQISHTQMLRGARRSGSPIHVFSVLYDGVLQVNDVDKFTSALRAGIGHGKAMGLGLLSVAPAQQG